MLLRKSLKNLSAALLLLLVWTGTGLPVCRGRFVNPITDVFWKCLFPIKIAGITIISGPEEGKPVESEDKVDSPICICPLSGPPFIRIGIPIAYWEPARILESVKDPFCFPSLGIGFGGLSGGTLQGTSASDATSKNKRQQAVQAHWYLFVPMALLEILTDFVCMEHSGFDVLYLTEVDPMWNDDILSLLIHPESLLFANPFAQLACTADAVTSTAVGYSLSPLFWCMGSWGSAYPLGGKISHGEVTEGSVALGSRMVYKLGREGLLWDTAIDMCYAVPSLIWVKHHWRLQLLRPKVGRQCVNIGKEGFLWGSAKNIPKPGSDNFAIMVFRKRRCCAF